MTETEFNALAAQGYNRIPVTLETFADLDTPLFMAENPFRGGYKLNRAQISVARIAAGHGVTPR